MRSQPVVLLLFGDLRYAHQREESDTAFDRCGATVRYYSTGNDDACRHVQPHDEGSEDRITPG